MHDTPEAALPLPKPSDRTVKPAPTTDSRKFLAASLVLLAAFSLPLFRLVRFALQSELYSHVILIPFISLYLVWLKRRALPPSSPPDHRLAIFPFIAGGALLALGFATALTPVDALALDTLAFVLLLLGLCALFFGPATLRALAFPLGFLFFLAPFPTAISDGISSALQHTSASAAYLLFTLSGATVFRHETYFQLPGINLLVAPECSGIHSTLALFITSLLAGYFFLRSPWKRAVLALVVVPLAILRNGFRVFVIGELCVHIGPEMIDSPIHHRGGPIFFILSLVPFFLILHQLMKSERRRPQLAPTAP